RTHSFRGRQCWIAENVGAVLGYTSEGWRAALRECGDELIEGKDIETLSGADLCEFDLASGTRVVLGRTPSLVVLYASGLSVLCLRTRQPIGVKLRRLMVDIVLPGLRRGTLARADAARELVSLMARLHSGGNASKEVFE